MERYWRIASTVLKNFVFAICDFRIPGSLYDAFIFIRWRITGKNKVKSKQKKTSLTDHPLYSVMHSDGNSVVLDSVNMAWSDKDRIFEQIYEKQIFFEINEGFRF